MSSDECRVSSSSKIGAFLRVLTPPVGNDGLGAGDQVNATSNDLIEATCPDIAALWERGVTIVIDDEVTQLCGF